MYIILYKAYIGNPCIDDYNIMSDGNPGNQAGNREGLSNSES